MRVQSLDKYYPSLWWTQNYFRHKPVLMVTRDHSRFQTMTGGVAGLLLQTRRVGKTRHGKQPFPGAVQRNILQKPLKQQPLYLILTHSTWSIACPHAFSEVYQQPCTNPAFVNNT